MKIKKIYSLLILAFLFCANANAADFEKDVFETKSGKKLEVTFIKHGSLMFDYDGKIIYVDPVSDYADYSKMQRADIILITHEHSDHYDPKAIADIKKPETVIVANPSVKQKMGDGVEMRNGDRKQVAPYLNILAVPAYNTSKGREIYHPQGRDNGYVLLLEDLRIYIAGDTEDIPEMKDLKDIDIAFLPVNQPYTMTIAQVENAALMFKPRILYPYHYGATKIEGLKEALKDNPEIEVRIRQMQ